MNGAKEGEQEALMISTNKKGVLNNWYLDSAAMNHVTNNKDLLTNYQKIVPTII